MSYNGWRPGRYHLTYCASPAKPSKPSRAYLHLTKQEFLGQLSEKIRSTTFNDSKGSTKDPALLGPASVDFAPYGRVPHSRIRKDLRQGTIDQDPEFIDFLESLTNPISKPVTVDQESDSTNKTKEKITVTPLIQFLRDKKANKGKESTTLAKSVKPNRLDSKDGKQSPTTDKKASVKALATAAPSPDKRSPQAIKVEKAARDAVRVLNKQAVNSNKSVATVASPAAPPAVAPPVSASPSPLADKKRERGSASAAARILQRDLGLGVSPGGRGGRRGAPGISGRMPANNLATTVKQDPSQASKEPGAPGPETVAAPGDKISALPATTPPSLNKLQAPVKTPTGPSAVRSPPKTYPSPAINNIASNSGSPLPKATPAPSTATQAFLKHANPSQGITEPLLEEAFAGFGTIKKVEIDKKKGFAYVEFADQQGLQNAIQASPVKVAQGQVVVLERKTGSTLQARNMRGGSPMMGNRGGGIPINRGGGAPMVPRSGRGGSVRRGGGHVRGAAPFQNPTAPKVATTTASPSSLEDAPAGPSATTTPDKSAGISSTDGSATVTASAISATPSEPQGT